jgi:PIN domain nuclease of toxin-antitoxin system
VKLLLDTCTFLWALHEPARLSAPARKALRNPLHSVHVSVITFWEISLKAGLGKLSLKGVTPEEYPALAAEAGWTVHPLAPGLAASAGRLCRNREHRDPFDRLLIWTAINEDFALVSGDKFLPDYAPQGLRVCW